MSQLSESYIVYGPPISLFTRKLESALRFYGAPYESASKDASNQEELEVRAATHQVPVLRTPENWLLADTTPIIELLDARFPQRRLFPTGPLGVVVHIVEEVLDEWIARVMVHYRWHYPENTRHVVAALLGREISLEEAQKFPLAQWGPRSCRATGTEHLVHQQAAEQEYIRLLNALEAQLGESRFALGNRPTAVDAILLGGLRAHTNADPYPDLSTHPRVQDWDARGADAAEGGGGLAPFPKTTPFAEHMLSLARDHYGPVAMANARALDAGDKAFVVETYGEPCSYLTRPYPERSRRMILDRIRHKLSPDERTELTQWLEERRLSEFFLP